MRCVTGQSGRGGCCCVLTLCVELWHTNTEAFFPPHLTCYTGQQGAAQPWQVATASRTHRQSATISLSVHAHGYLCLSAQTGVWQSLTKLLVGYCIDASHARVAKTEDRTDRLYQPTCDVHVHNASASPDAVGGVTDVRAGLVVGYWPLEEQGVVLDFHITGQGAVQAVVRERERR